ncbi:SusC/RagA family protein [Chryseobacterium indologenes]|uniref:SusC/RagA family TonB-linked outer membrane protein n=1 Tax=Chryseobacterium indologenes TaxID=253 RepID=UPI000BFE0D5A|nr:SusC/RagA family TonB-linked outer membrane protein [Chryseobacterium indologenes]ATN06865.1 SusC/RagA family protein [Chryseobacterium indologenes]AYY84389.1 SusC/RagA family TonB-linked outer membrane protein [Chryseobacterium indologenes]QIX81343.1 SusC/RagA family TonB-linked outer membrane protein [Chryseobacterium indologenes]TLX25694.1 SusC/RagA family TonB-linked outer membrane protein [Chryseobacterium indologenes]UDQ55091.1 SusC/RagA family TonB-linked outer membrane protein [Chry
MNVFKIPVSVSYLTGRVLLIGAISASPMFLSQKNDSIKEKSIDEVVVVGYGTQKKSKVSGAVAEASLDKLSSRSLSGVGEVLQGKAPGVTVVNEGGDPNGVPKVNIRGLGGVNGETPLYVVDGVVFNGTPNINPNDIQDISILKDASAAIYGARSSGGVILITTKRGKKGALTVDFDVKYGINQAWRLKESLNAAEFQNVMRQAYENAGKLSSLPMAFNADKYTDGGITRTNWMNEIFRTGTIQEYNVNLSGGSEKSRFFVGMNHRNLEGILLNTQAKRYNFRVNSEHKVKDWLTIGENMYYSYSDGNTANTKNGYTGALVAAMYYPPNVSVYTPTGAFSGLPIDVAGGYGDMINPVAYLKRISIQNPTHEILINPYIEVSLAKDLKFRSNFSQTFKLGNIKEFTSRVLEVGKIFDTNSLEYQSNNISTSLAEQLLTYKFSLGKHNFDALAGFTFQKTTEDGFRAKAFDFRSEAEVFRYLQNAADTNKEVYSYKYRQALTSYLARVNYDYAGKYIISLLGRRDGTSLVAKQNHFANYYSVSGGWVASKENFMNEISWLSNLKLRGSYGILGNLGGVSFQAVNPLMIRDNNIIFGQDPTQNIAYYATTKPNRDLKWGKSEQTNFGVDASFFHNSLSLQFDYFVKKSTHQIFNVNLSSTELYIDRYLNAGLFQDKGYELGINYNGKSKGDFTYSIGATISQLKNTVKQLAGVDEIFVSSNNVRGVLKPTRIKVGESLYSYYGYRTGGIFQTQAEIDNYKDANGNLIQPNAKPGDIKFLKKDGNTGTLNNNDFVNLGNPYPKFSYGLSYNMTWKNFDLNLFFQGVYGNKIFNGLKFISLNPGGTGQNYNMDRDILNAWTPQNTNTNIPRLMQGDPGGNYSKVSDFYVEDGSYLRLKNLTVGYSLPGELYKKLDVNKIRVYVTSNNLFTITKYTGFDPEVGMETYGVDTGRYPQARSFIFGLEVGF